MSKASSLSASPPAGTRPRAARGRGPSLEKTARTREAIVRAALAEFLERGYARATMADVARRAGLAQGTAYHYFDGKAALFAGLVEDVVVRPLFQTPLPDLPAGEPLGGFLYRTLSPLMHALEGSGRATVMRLVMAEAAAHPQLVELYRDQVFNPMLAQVRRVARQARARGDARAAVLVRHPHLLMAPAWMGVVSNTVLGSSPRVRVGALFDQQLELLYPDARAGHAAGKMGEAPPPPLSTAHPRP